MILLKEILQMTIQGMIKKIAFILLIVFSGCNEPKKKEPTTTVKELVGIYYDSVGNQIIVVK